MTRRLVHAGIVLSAIAFLIFGGVALTEVNYVADHPNAYGPAKVIAWAAAGGAFLAVAVGLLAFAALDRERT